MANLEGVQHVVLTKALKMLDSLPVQYYIRVDDDTSYSKGDLQMAAAKRAKKRPSKYPFGSVSAYILPYIKDLQPGQVARVPIGGFRHEYHREFCNRMGLAQLGQGNLYVHQAERNGV